MTAELVLRWSGGELDLMGWNESTHGDFELATLADGTDWGNPVPVRRALRRFLLDGSASVKEYDDNRTIPLSLRVKAPSGAGLAGGEAALVLATDARCELVWTPPSAFSKPAVFVVVSADLTHKMDDLGETLHGERYYTLTLDAVPHAYSDEWVDVPALAQDVSVPSTVDDCSSLTGWSATNADLSVISALGDTSVIRVVRTGGGPIVVTRAGTVDFSTQPVLALNAYPAPAQIEVQAVAEGPWLLVDQDGTDAGRAVFNVGAVAASVVAMRLGVSSDWDEARVFQLDKQATHRSVASRQQIRAASIPGSRRTPGTLLVESPATGLGTTIVYTGPAYDPTWSEWSVSTRTTNASNLSGGSNNVAVGGTGNPILFQRPVATLPAGSHVLWGRLFADAAGILEISVELYDSTGSTLLASRSVASFSLDTAGSWVVMPLAHIDLPGFGLPAGSTALVRLKLNWVGPAIEFGVDELLAFLQQAEDGTTYGPPTVAKCGANRSLWLDAPSLEQQAPAVFVGGGTKAGARALSLASEMPSWGGAHALTPPQANLYVACVGTADATVSATFRPAWHTHPAALESS